MGTKHSREGGRADRSLGVDDAASKTVMSFDGKVVRGGAAAVAANQRTTDTDDKTVMGGPGAPPGKKPAADTSSNEKTVMAGPPGAPPGAKPAADSNEKTVMAGPPPAPGKGGSPAPGKGGSPAPGKGGSPAPANKAEANESTVMVGGPPMGPPVDPPTRPDMEGATVAPSAQQTNISGPTTSQSFFSTPSSHPSSPPSSRGSDSGSGSGGAAGAMPEPGQRMNQYEIIRLIGEGGMGSVFLARDTKLGRRVAIKFLQSSDPALTQRFIIEARATARVEHENIVSIYEVGEWSGSPYMVLQFLQGQELKKLIPRGKRMPVPRVVELMTPVLRALSYAHGEGIVHRDLKPDNVFVTDAGVIKVLDFGIAKVVQGEDRTSDGEGVKLKAEELAALGGDDKNMTRHGAIMGTMPYMSPEQWGNGVTIDNTTDIWAAGIIMYIMLTGKHPLDPLQGTELMVTGFLDEPTPSLADKAPDLPKELVAAIDKCLVKDKAQRWPDALALLRALEPFQPGRYAAAGKSDRIEESPYAGLSSFQEEDANRFFGRKREVAAMGQRLRERPIMAVVGPSGVGKSSFVRAGVVPALKNSGESWDISVIRPGRSPLMSIANLLSQSAGTSKNVADDVSEQHKLADRLREEPGYLGTVMRRTARKDRKHLMLFVDQFEELYTLVSDPAERLAFTACLSATADDPTSPVRVVVSIRSDFLDRCVEDQHFMTELSQGLFFMQAPSRDGMRDALVLPAEMAGYKFENEAVVDEMLDHLAQTSGALPLLQFTADKLWAERDPSRRLLTEKSYRNLGGIAGALASHADRVLDQMPPDQKPLVRALLLRLVTPDRTRAIVPVEDLKEHLGKSGDVQGLIDQMVAARLLTVQTGGGGSGATVELVHESLINGWPQLSRWLDEGHEDAAFMEQLRNAARQWATKGQDSGLLWRGEMVEEAKRFQRRYRGQLPDQQQHFLKAVVDLSTRAARLRRTLYVTGAIVLMALLAAAAVALVVISESQAQATKAAVIAKQAEEKATTAAEEAERRKEEAEQALADTKKAQDAKNKAQEAELRALDEVKAKQVLLEKALVETRQSEARAQANALEASDARAEAEQRAIEATEARNAATKAAGELKVALVEVEQQRKAAVAREAEAVRKLKVMTKGGIVEVLQ